MHKGNGVLTHLAVVRDGTTTLKDVDLIVGGITPETRRTVLALLPIGALVVLDLTQAALESRPAVAAGIGGQRRRRVCIDSKLASSTVDALQWTERLADLASISCRTRAVTG